MMRMMLMMGQMLACLLYRDLIPGDCLSSVVCRLSSVVWSVAPKIRRPNRERGRANVLADSLLC